MDIFFLTFSKTCTITYFDDIKKMLPIDLYTKIFNLFDLKSQINMISTYNYLKNNLFSTDLYNQDNIILNKLISEILKQKKYTNLIKLNAKENNLIKNVSFLKNLKILNAEKIVELIKTV